MNKTCSFVKKVTKGGLFMSVVVIIPAYNEEQTVEKIIKTAKTVNLVDRVVVVSDGSVDNTVDVASKTGVEVIDLKENIGKGGAMNAGVNACDEDIIVFLDADLVGLEKEHIEGLIKPVMENKTDMTIGIFSNGKVGTDLAQKVAPFLSGQRALKRELFNSISDIEISRFGVEMALTKYVKENAINYQKVDFDNVTHVTKEKKLSFWKEFFSRMNMYYDILKNLLVSK